MVLMQCCQRAKHGQTRATTMYRKGGRREKAFKFRSHPYERAPIVIEREVVADSVPSGVSSGSFFRFGSGSIVYFVNGGRVGGDCDKN